MITVDVNGARAVGKTTLVRSIEKFLQECGYEVVTNPDNMHSPETMRERVQTVGRDKMLVVITDGGYYGQREIKHAPE